MNTTVKFFFSLPIGPNKIVQQENNNILGDILVSLFSCFLIRSQNTLAPLRQLQLPSAGAGFISKILLWPDIAWHTMRMKKYLRK